MFNEDKFIEGLELSEYISTTDLNVISGYITRCVTRGKYDPNIFNLSTEIEKKVTEYITEWYRYNNEEFPEELTKELMRKYNKLSTRNVMRMIEF